MKVKGGLATRGDRAKTIVAIQALRSASSGSMAITQTILVRILVLGLSLSTGILTARFLGPAGRAEQAAMLIGLSFFPLMVSFGLPVAVQYKLRQAPESQDRLVSAATLLAVAFGVLAIIVGFLILPRLTTKYPPSIVHLSREFMLAAPFSILSTVFCGVLQARSRFAEVNFTLFAGPIITLSALVTLLTMHRLTPITASIAYIVPSLLVVPWLWARIRPRFTLRGFRETGCDLLNYGSRSYVSDILGTAWGQIDQVLVISLLNPASMGLYAVAITVARASDLFTGSIVTVLFPKASGLPLQQIVELTSRVARLTFLLLSVSTAFCFLAMPFVLPAFFGQAYRGAIPLAQILLVTAALNGTGYVLAQAFMAAGKPGVIAILQALGLATTIGFMILLIPRFGLFGAALATAISGVVCVSVVLPCFPLVLKVPIPSLIVTVDDVRFLKATFSANMSQLG